MSLTLQTYRSTVTPCLGLFPLHGRQFKMPPNWKALFEVEKCKMCIFQTKLKKNFAVCVFSKSILTERIRKRRRRLRSLLWFMPYLKCFQTACVPLLIGSWRVLPTVLISWWSHRTIDLFSRKHNLNMALSASQQTAGWRLNSTKWSALQKNAQVYLVLCWPSKWLCCKFVHSLYFSVEVH